MEQAAERGTWEWERRARTVQCSACGAEPGQPCQRVGGVGRRHMLAAHRVRIEAAQRVGECRTFYVLVCLMCDPDAEGPIPFPSAEERGRWAAAHTAGTGHEKWIVIDQPDTTERP
jgi:hypothetical protein